MPYPMVKCVNPKCQNMLRQRPGTTGLCRSCIHGNPVVEIEVKPSDLLATDRSKREAKTNQSQLQLKYNEALRLLDQKDREFEVLGVLQSNIEPVAIEPHFGSGTSEATPVLVASDWHCEEIVGAEVGDLNRYDPEEAKLRSTRFFQSGLRLVRLLNQDVSIKTVVLALLGDFITNDIHGAENAEKNAMQPTQALVFAQNLLIGGIEFLLNHSDYELVLPCHSGNHARTTLTTRFAAENGHSLEYLMYLHLAAYFRTEPRIKFIVGESYHSYLSVYDEVIRFHHGHGAKYQGGVGGIYIPVNKSIAQWQKGRHADLDVFGHFHQLRDGGNFICNGSLIGMNAFALSIKADYEPPRQALFLMDKKRGRTCLWPILVDK